MLDPSLELQKSSKLKFGVSFASKKEKKGANILLAAPEAGTNFIQLMLSLCLLKFSRAAVSVSVFNFCIPSPKVAALISFCNAVPWTKNSYCR